MLFQANLLTYLDVQDLKPRAFTFHTKYMNNNPIIYQIIVRDMFFPIAYFLMERTDFYTFVRVMAVSEKVRKCNCMQCFKGFLSVQADMRKADAISNLLDFRKLSWLFFTF